MAPLELFGSWIEPTLRWLHVAAASVWLGAVFWFWNLGSRPEAWRIHEDGSLYRIRAHGDAPPWPPLPERVLRFRWGAYVTWAAGFGLLVLVYLAHPTERLVGPASPAWLAPGPAVGLALGSLLVGYLLYEALCRSPLGRRDRALSAGVVLLLVGLALLHAALLAPRAALLLDGAVAGTIMVANVAHVIVPGERKILAALRDGRVVPAPELAARARQRLAHNALLTPAVVAAMLAGHPAPAWLAGGGSVLAFALGLLLGVLPAPRSR